MLLLRAVRFTHVRSNSAQSDVFVIHSFMSPWHVLDLCENKLLSKFCSGNKIISSNVSLLDVTTYFLVFLLMLMGKWQREERFINQENDLVFPSSFHLSKKT